MIRDYTDSDFKDCLSIVNEVWQFDKHFPPKELSDLFLRIYAGGSYAGSNFVKVVEEDGRVKGFIFGKLEHRKLFKNEFSGLIGQIRILWKLLKIKRVPLKKKFSYLNMMNTHEINRRKAEPRKSSEVTLFAAAPDSQGKGYGKLLINEFISACKAENIKRIILETDAECNYGFYQNLGFNHITSFYSPLQKEFTGVSGETFIFELIMRDTA